MEVIYKGPPSHDVAGQVQVISQWVQQRLDAITVSADDLDALAPGLKQAMDAGIKTSAWNADVAADARELFMDNPPPANLGEALVEQMIEEVGPRAKLLLMTSSLQSPNQNAFLDGVKDALAARYPDVEIQKVLPGEADTARSFGIAKAWLQAHPETNGILTVDGSELAGAAQAVDGLGLKGKVTLVGIGVPSQNGEDLLSGTAKAVVLWNPIDLGYATIQMVHAQLCGTLKPGAESFTAGRLGELRFTSEDTITLGEPLVFTRDNVKDFDF
jgi:rhamnose transport system substrate-binding protein